MAIVLASMVDLLESARRASARAVNSIMTATYSEIGRRIVELEQGGEERARYGQGLLESLSEDLTQRFGRGFSIRNLRSMRMFYRKWPIRQTLSAESVEMPSEPSGEIRHTLSTESAASLFPLPWSHYLSLLRVKSETARKFYEEEAIRGGCGLAPSGIGWICCSFIDGFTAVVSSRSPKCKAVIYCSKFRQMLNSRLAEKSVSVKGTRNLF